MKTSEIPPGISLNSEEILLELAVLGGERTKKIYMNHGAKQPLFGVTISSMKPLAKKVSKNQKLAEELYATGNYDAMYFAGMIAEPNIMTEADYNRWINLAYCHMISDWIVAVTLAESNIGQEIANKWLYSSRELTKSGGWSCWTWMIGNRSDNEFGIPAMKKLLEKAKEDIVKYDGIVRTSIRNFLVGFGISYKPLHDEILQVAQAIDAMRIKYHDSKDNYSIAEHILSAAKKGRIGFKRKNVRC